MLSTTAPAASLYLAGAAGQRHQYTMQLKSGILVHVSCSLARSTTITLSKDSERKLKRTIVLYLDDNRMHYYAPVCHYEGIADGSPARIGMHSGSVYHLG